MKTCLGLSAALWLLPRQTVSQCSRESREHEWPLLAPWGEKTGVKIFGLRFPPPFSRLARDHAPQGGGQLEGGRGGLETKGQAFL